MIVFKISQTQNFKTQVFKTLLKFLVYITQNVHPFSSFTEHFGSGGKMFLRLGPSTNIRLWYVAVFLKEPKQISRQYFKLRRYRFFPHSFLFIITSY
jgi:hypothetical protein